MKYLYIFLYVGLAVSVYSVPLATVENAKEKDVKYYFYSRTNTEGIHVTIQEVDDVTHIRTVFNPDHPTVVLIHGWHDGYGADSNRFIRKAILSTTDANIIKVDWSINAGKFYIIAKNAVPSVGKYAAHFLSDIIEEFNYSLDQITIVGFSLGAHVAGHVGKSFNGQLPLIIGLDPAGVFISSKDTRYCLNPADAKYVGVIHTDAGSAGMKDAIGHSDFYPNGGNDQPGCSDIGCSHNRAWELYAESIKNNKFVSQQCDTYATYISHECTGDHILMGGISVNKSANGIYYLTTNAESPYGRGEE